MEVSNRERNPTTLRAPLMASAWITTRATADGGKRYRVLFRLGGGESVPRYGGSFKTQKHAITRKAWIISELVAQRVPNLALLDAEPVRAPTLAEVVERWKATRVDVAESTRVLHRVALDRVLPILGTRHADEITVTDIVGLVAQLHSAGKKRETIRKSVKYLAAVLDYAEIDPNPARDRNVRLPHEDREELEPPTADQVEAVYWLIPLVHRLALLWLDWSGARVGSIDTLLVSDYDRSRRRVRLRAAVSKSRRALWVDLPDALADALDLGTAGRGPDERLFAESGADALRTAIAKACAALGIPLWSPHDLRHRRVSLLHRQGRSWAEVAAFVGQRKLSITADTYTHVLLDDRELDYRELLARAA